MRKILIPLLALLAAPPAFAQHQGHDMHQMETPPAADPHAGHDMGGQSEDESPPPRPAPEAPPSGPTHAADSIFGTVEMEKARRQLRAETGGMTTFKLLANRLEYRAQQGKDGYIWDLRASYGGDIDTLVLKSEGEGAYGKDPESVEVQGLWSHAITPFFDFQAGVRHDILPDPGRTHLVIGIEGLAPYMFEVDAAIFLSHKGDMTARLEAEYDQRITRTLILQPHIEANFAAQDVPELGIGSGLSSIEAGLRLHYRIAPEFSPYLGVEWEGLAGDTGGYARANGEERNVTRAVVGIRAWF